MRVLILVFLIAGVFVSANAAKAGLILANRDVSASVDPGTPTENLIKPQKISSAWTRENVATFSGG